jgi:hypothetical protein
MMPGGPTPELAEKAKERISRHVKLGVFTPLLFKAHLLLRAM